jgi:glycosyltransferase involved in cell wall biosynthesis
LEKKYKILAIADAAFASTGYGNQSDIVLTRLVERGWDVYQLQCNAFTLHRCEPGDEYPMYKGIKIIPNTEIAKLGTEGLYGTKESIWEIYNKIKPDVIWSCNDFYRIAGLTEFPQEFIDKFVYWNPIDNPYMPDNWSGDKDHFLNRMRFVIFMSHFGWEVQAKYLPHVMFMDAVYLGVPSKMFKPLYSKEELKNVTGFHGKFVIITVARHQPRKMVWKTANVVAKFLKNHPDTVWYCKTDPNDPSMASYPECQKDLISIMKKEGVEPREGVETRVFFEPRQFSIEQMNELYNTGDVFIHISGGEGFGIPYVESMMAGTPCILSDNTTSPELTGGWKFGLPVKIKDKVTLAAFNSTYDLADEDDAYKQLEFTYNDWKNGSKWLKEAGKKAREFHIKWCDADVIVDKWEEYFYKMIEYNENKPPKIPMGSVSFDGDYFTNISKYDERYHSDWGKFVTEQMTGSENNIIDVGCGTGYLMKHMLKEGKNVVGIDISEWAVANPISGCEGRIFNGSITDIPYDDDAFDYAVAFSVLEHIPEQDAIQALKEIRRVSKKAFFMIAMDVGVGWKEKLEAEDPTHINIKTMEWWEDKFKIVGLKVIKSGNMCYLVERV